MYSIKFDEIFEVSDISDEKEKARIILNKIKFDSLESILEFNVDLNVPTLFFKVELPAKFTEEIYGIKFLVEIERFYYSSLSINVSLEKEDMEKAINAFEDDYYKIYPSRKTKKDMLDFIFA